MFLGKSTFILCDLGQMTLDVWVSLLIGKVQIIKPKFQELL